MATKKGAKKATKTAAKKKSHKKKVTKKNVETTKGVTKVTPKSGSPTPINKQVSYQAAIISAIIVVVIVALALLFVNLERFDQTDDPVIVTVNGQAILLSEVSSAYNALPPEYQAQFTKDQVLEQLIEKTIIIQYAHEQGIKATNAQVQERIDEQLENIGIPQATLQQVLAQGNVSWKEYYEAVREEVTLLQFVEEIILEEVVVSEQEIQEYYAKNSASYSAGEGEIRVRHILVETEDEAWSVFEKAQTADFAALAREHSIGPTGPTGGSLGFISPDDALVEEFKTAAFALTQGEVSEPVNTMFGWHIILREANSIPLSEVRQQIRESIRQQKGEQKFVELIRELRRTADVSYFDIGALAENQVEK